MTNWLEQFKAMYQGLNSKNLAQLEHWYHPDVIFEDPLHKVEGLAQLTRYFSLMYENVESISFDYQWQMQDSERILIGWRMAFSHRKLNSGNTIHVQGISLLICQADKVISHRDYFDSAEMLYEHVPVLGRLIKLIKRRVAAS